MTKKILALVLEFILILFLGIVLLIIVTGGVSFSLGPLTVKIRHFKNPATILGIALILRRIFSGSFFRGFISLKPLQEAFLKSGYFRRFVFLFPFLLVLLMGVAAWINPLQRGLAGSYYDNAEWNGDPIMRINDSTLELWRMQLKYPDITENYSIHWDGVLLIPSAGGYEFTTVSDDGSELHIDNRLIVDNRGRHNAQERIGRVQLEKGFHPISIRYVQYVEGSHLKVYWQAPEKKRQLLSYAPLFAEKPTKTAFFVGRGLEVFVILGKVLLLGCILVGFIGRRLFLSSLKESFLGKLYRKYRSRLIKEDVPKHAVPVVSKTNFSPFLIALGGYALISLVWTYPLIGVFSEKMIGWGGDRYIYLWNMWWMKKALLDLHTNPLYTDYLFYPQGISLAFHDFSLFLTCISLPLQRIFTLQEIYNIFFLATYIIGGGGCFLLVRYLTGDNLAAFFSGVVFVFWGGRAYYVDHFYLAAIQWIPYCALYLLKTLRESSYRNPALAALFLVVNALTSWVYAVYMVLFVGLFLIYSAWSERKTLFTASCIKRFVLIGVLFLILMTPVLYPMVTEMLEGEQYMNAPVISPLSINLDTLLLPNPSHGILGKYITSQYLKANITIQGGVLGGAFIGYTVLLLCMYTVLKLRHLKRGFWIVGGIFFLLLALGPHPWIFAREFTKIPLPYLILARIPILKTLRVPERFMIMVMLCCSVLVGYACWDIFRRIRLKKTVFVMLTALTLFEFFRFYFINPVEETPEFYTQLGQDPEAYAILELTRLTELSHAARRSSLFQTGHEKKLFNGFVARVAPRSYPQAYRLYRVFDDFLIQPWKYHNQADPSFLKADKGTLLAMLSYYNVHYVSLYHDYWYGSFRENYRRLVELLGPPVAEQPGAYFFKIEQTPVTEDLVFPGHGMFALEFQADGTPNRKASRDGDIKVINVKHRQKMRLRFEGQSSLLPEEILVQIVVNDAFMKNVLIGDWVEVTVPDIPIQPGENTITLHMPYVEDWYAGIYLRNIEVELL